MHIVKRKQRAEAYARACWLPLLILLQLLLAETVDKADCEAGSDARGKFARYLRGHVTVTAK